jgi:hypothetical protein
MGTRTAVAIVAAAATTVSPAPRRLLSKSLVKVPRCG